jgi:hypothetical protein
MKAEVIKIFVVIFSGLIIFSGNNVFAQPQPQPIPCLIYNSLVATQNGSPTNIQSIHCVEVSDYNTTTTHEIKAGDNIKLKPNTHFKPTGTNSIHAYITGYDVAWYEPVNTVETVGINDKLELGVKLDSQSNNKVMNFVNNLNGDKLNPYNPEEVDVYAVFTREFVLYGNTYTITKKINGFFYKEFIRNTNDWTEIPTDYNFRIRFTPTILGQWNCVVHVNINGTNTLTTNQFQFNCVPSNKKGFMKVGENHRYFKIDNDPFFPVGRNLQTMDTLAADASDDKISSGAWSPTPLPAYRYLLYHDLLAELKLKGGNYFRYLVSPWLTEIEFEHLNNYSERMNNAWEFDRILDVCEDLDLRMQLNMQIHFAFETPSGYAMTNWDWPKKGDPLNIFCVPPNDSGYCYRRELGLENALDFLTNTDAIKYYKYRLRYMIARWGYSTNIAVLELVSEINAIGSTRELKKVYNYTTDPLTGQVIDSSFVGCTGIDSTTYKPHPNGCYDSLPCPSCNDIYNWQITMLKYIKEDLGHTEHLLTTSNGGYPNVADTTWNSPYVDIRDYNLYYSASPLHYIGVYNEVDNFVFNDKPFMHSETGGGNIDECSGSVTEIKDLFLQPFTGIPVAGMNWEGFVNQYNNWHYMQTINNFMSGLKLDEENFQPQPPLITSDKTLMTLYLVSEPMDNNSRKAVGVICNNTFNYHTNGSGGKCDDTTSYDSLNASSSYNLSYNHADPITNLNDDFGSYKNYTIKFYNAITGNQIYTLYTNSDLFGKLNISIDELITGDYTQPIILFEIIPDGYSLRQNMVNVGGTNNESSTNRQSNKTHTDSTVLSNKNFTNNYVTSVEIMPNPTTGVVNVRINSRKNSFHYVVLDVNGKTIMKKIEYSPNFSIDLSSYENGMYYLLLTDENEPQYFKLIKQ